MFCSDQNSFCLNLLTPKLFIKHIESFLLTNFFQSWLVWSCCNFDNKHLTSDIHCLLLMLALDDQLSDLLRSVVFSYNQSKYFHIALCDYRLLVFYIFSEHKRQTSASSYTSFEFCVLDIFFDPKLFHSHSKNVVALFNSFKTSRC